MKKNIIYAAILLIGMLLAYFPYGNIQVEPNFYEVTGLKTPDEIKQELQNSNHDQITQTNEQEMEQNMVQNTLPQNTENLSEITIFETVDDTENTEKDIVPESEIQTGMYDEEEISASDITVNNSSTESKSNDTEQNNEEFIITNNDNFTPDKPDYSDKNTTEQKEEQVPIPRNPIPEQSESTSASSQAKLNMIRQEISKYITANNGGEIAESADLKNAAIAKLNGQPGSAMDVLTSLGGNGWLGANWQEFSAYEYCLDTSDTVLKDTAKTLCSYIGTSYKGKGYTQMGIGVSVVPDDNCYKITVEIILTD